MAVLEVILWILLLLAFVFFVRLIPAFLIKKRAKRLGANITLSDAYAHHLHKTDTDELYRAIAFVQKHELPINSALLETHLLAGGNLSKVLRGMLHARSQGIDLHLNYLFAIDLAGLDIIEELDKQSEG